MVFSAWFVSLNQQIINPLNITIMTMLSIYNSISDYDCYDPEFGAVAISLGFDLETALETALLAFDCCTPDNTCSYSEHICTPFGTDEQQCESDWRYARLWRSFDEDLPF